MHQLSSMTALYPLASSQVLSYSIHPPAGGFVTSSVGQMSHKHKEYSALQLGQGNWRIIES